MSSIYKYIRIITFNSIHQFINNQKWSEGILVNVFHLLVHNKLIDVVYNIYGNVHDSIDYEYC